MERNEAQFDALIRSCEGLLRRYIARRITRPEDADDLFQETLIAAWRGFDRLRDPDHSVAWLLQIARNRCRDHFRKRESDDCPFPDRQLTAFADRRRLMVARPNPVAETVREALAALPDVDRSITERFYLEGSSLEEIASADAIPLGTAKRRLFQARQRLRSALAIPPNRRSPSMETMSGNQTPEFPATCPEIQIKPLNRAPFDIDCMELRWWSIIPRENERAAWAAYDAADARLSWTLDLAVLRPAFIEGVSGVEIAVHEEKPLEGETHDWTVYGCLTEDAARYLAIQTTTGGVTEWRSFLDPDFAWDWGACPRKIVGQSDSAPPDRFTPVTDLFGQTIGSGVYSVQVAEETYTCLRVLETPENPTESSAHLIVAYLTAAGRTILTRHYVSEHFGTWYQGPIALRHDAPFILGDVSLYHWYDTLTTAAFL